MASVADINRVFHLNLGVYKGPNRGVSCNLYACTYALDSTRAVQSIELTNSDGSHEAFALAITLPQQ
ncbi:MAG: hypothetical protein WBQ08_19345 [Candidatus Sulfotelmatobacter sp.]